jgi:hypothetical protein
MTQFFVGIAAPRCGTTWLWRQLKRCPNVIPGKPKELGWFVPNNKHAIASDADYLRRLGCEKGRPMPGMVHHEFTPGYVECTPEAFQRMDEVMPGVRFVAVLRHPVERALSHARFIGRQLDGDVRWDDALSNRVLRRGRYRAMFENLDAAGMRDRLIVTTTERLFARPDQEFREITTFAGIQPGWSLKMESVNRTKPAKAPERIVRVLRNQLKGEIEVWKAVNHGSKP